MAQFTVNATRFDPYKSFMFRVKWDGQYVAGPLEDGRAQALDRPGRPPRGRRPVARAQEPGQVEVRRRSRSSAASRTTPRSRQWANLVHSLKSADLAEELPQGHHRRRLQRGRPEGAVVPPVPLLGLGVPGAARSSTPATAAVAIQTIKLELEGWERDESVTEPTEHVGRQGRDDGGCTGAGRPERRRPRSPRSAPRDDELGQVLALLRARRRRASRRRSSVGAGDRRLLGCTAALTGRDSRSPSRCAACGDGRTSPCCRRRPCRPRRRAAAWLGPGGGLREPTYADLLGLPDDRGRGRGGAPAPLHRRDARHGPAAGGARAGRRLADGPIVLACVECGSALEVAADVEQLALEGCSEHAADVELEIHLLARAYGWSLSTIEALPDERRSRLARFVADGR